MRTVAHILIIDDDQFCLQHIARLLQMRGHETSVAMNGVEGVRKARCHRPDIVITDIFMPEREGIETIVELRSVYGDLPIIAMSGGTRANPAAKIDYLAKATDIGASATLDKPVVASALSAAVDSLLKQAERERPTKPEALD
jgi:DNA-binding NtrC family response regulator